MTSLPLLDSFLTEFDDRISSELNLDPLGLQVIWSAYGQKIFRNRISSISNDVRNYTLNLFNHAVAKTLIEDDAVQLSRWLLNDKAYAGRGKDSAAFRQACLIYLENVFAYTMVQAEGQTDPETTGVLGISKARARWGGDPIGNPSLVFSHEPKAHVLVRQNSLGVSGRYKTPLVEMEFFDSGYDYALPAAMPQWELAERQLFSTAKPLASLKQLACTHLSDVVTDARRKPERNFVEVPSALRSMFVSAFRSPTVVGAYARDFWLAVTELDQGASGALYQVLGEEWQTKGRKQERTSAQVFARAARERSLSAEDKNKLEHVLLIEPFLGELSLLLDVVLSGKAQLLDNVSSKWTALGRDGHTLPRLAARIQGNAEMRRQLTGTAAERLGELLAVTQGNDVRQQAVQLLRYHDKVMLARGQSSWVRLQNGRELKIDVRARALPKEGARPVGAWVHHYYVPQFRHFLSGMRGLA